VRLARSLAVAAAVAMLLASCTGGSTPSETASSAPDPRVRGTLLVRTGFGGAFAQVELPEGRETLLPMPDFLRTVSGFFDDDGSVVALLEVSQGARLYRLAVDEEPVALGPPLPAGDTLSHGGGSALVTGCGTPPFARVLDLSEPTTWRTVDAGCGAALSADARSAVWSPDGETLVEAPIDGSSAPVIIADVADLSVPAGVSPAPAFAPPIALAEQGRAVALTTLDGWQGVAVDTDPPAASPLGDRGAGPLQVYLDWQPDGPLLAVASSTTLGGIVRLVDDGEPRVIAMFREPANGTVWGPDGTALLAASNGVWAVVDLDGAWLWSRIVGRGQEPLDWRAGA
jgi:hypothetical protein